LTFSGPWWVTIAIAFTATNGARSSPVDPGSSDTSHNSGALTSRVTFGHTGSSGSMLWADPTCDLICVMIGTRLAESGWVDGPVPRRAPFSNAVMAAVVE
jgi:CubicO group peptidase (beta-lactamase class C family)